jgi:hypothetical protein
MAESLSREVLDAGQFYDVDLATDKRHRAEGCNHSR